MTAAPKLTVTLPIPSGKLGPNGRAHWREKHRLFQEAKLWAYLEFRRAMGFQWDGYWPEPVYLDLLWVAKQKNHLPDVDNALARCKQYLDAGQEAGLYENDKQVQIRSIRREVGPEPRVELTFESGAPDRGAGG